MKYRVWCLDFQSAIDGGGIDALDHEQAARDYLSKIEAFPEDNDGDKCAIAVAEWSELGEDDEPEYRLVTFKLVIERRVEMV